MANSIILATRNMATRVLFEHNLDTFWRDNITCTKDSPYNLIVSDLLYASYEFCGTGNIEAIKVVLKVVKESPLKFHSDIRGDYFTSFNENNELSGKMTFKFSPDKMTVRIRFVIHNDEKPFCTLDSDNAKPPKGKGELILNYWKSVRELADYYNNL